MSINIDGRDVEFSAGETVLAAAARAGAGEPTRQRGFRIAGWKRATDAG